MEKFAFSYVFMFTVAVLFSHVFAQIGEVQVVPTVTAAGGIVLLQSSTQPTRDETTALLQGTGTYSSGGAKNGTLTYDFRHVINLTRIELVTMQSGPASTVHRLELGISNVNLFAYEWEGTTTDSQTLTFDFFSDAQVRMLRINTLNSSSMGVAWRSIKVFAMTKQFIPNPSVQHYRAHPYNSDFTVLTDALLAGTGSWSSGKAAATTPVKLYYDFNQLTRVDFLEITILNALPATTSLQIIGGPGVESFDYYLILTRTGSLNAGQVLLFPLNGTQYRVFSIQVANTGTSIIGYSSVRFFTAKSTPDLLFYPNQYGARVFLPGTLYTVSAPIAAVNSAVFQAYSGGGGCTPITGMAGAGTFMTGNITNFTTLKFGAGGVGSAVNQSGGWGNGVYDGGIGGGKFAAYYNQGGGGGGGATFILSSTGSPLLVLGGGGGGGSNAATGSNGGVGGAGGMSTFTPSGSVGLLGGATLGGSPGQGGGSFSSLGGDGQALGGGAGGGGYRGGNGGGTLVRNPYFAGAGGGGGGSTNTSINPSSGTGIVATVTAPNIGPMPGAFHLMWDYEALFIGPLSGWGLEGGIISAGSGPFQLGCGAVSANILVNVPVYISIWGTGALVNGQKYFSTTIEYPIGAAVFYFQPVSPGTVTLMCQTPATIQGGYLFYSRKFTIV